MSNFICIKTYDPRIDNDFWGKYSLESRKDIDDLVIFMNGSSRLIEELFYPDEKEKYGCRPLRYAHFLFLPAVLSEKLKKIDGFISVDEYPKDTIKEPHEIGFIGLIRMVLNNEIRLLNDQYHCNAIRCARIPGNEAIYMIDFSGYISLQKGTE